MSLLGGDSAQMSLPTLSHLLSSDHTPRTETHKDEITHHHEPPPTSQSRPALTDTCASKDVLLSCSDAYCSAGHDSCLGEQ